MKYFKQVPLKNFQYTEIIGELPNKPITEIVATQKDNHLYQPIERIRLVEAILYSLDKPDPDIEQSWIAESEARYDAYKRGELEAIDWDEIKKRLER